MDDDEMTPEEFRAAMASGVPVHIVDGPRPIRASGLPGQPTIHITAETFEVSVQPELAGAPIRRPTTRFLDVRPHAMVPAWVR